MAKHKKNQSLGTWIRNNKKVTIAAASAILIIGVGAVTVSAISNHNKNKNENTAGVTLNEMNLTGNESQTYIGTEETTVEITLDDCAVPVGMILQATAIVTPENTDKALSWTSSNTDVFTVNEAGLVSVTGIGTSVLTATVGNVSDAVIIEGIASIASGSTSNLPIYTGDSLDKSSVNYSTAGNAASCGTGSNSENVWTGSNLGNNSDNSGSGNTSGDTSGNDNSGSNDNNDGNSNSSGSGNGGSNSNSNSGSTGGSGSSDSDKSGSTSSEIGGMLPGMGFEHNVSNVYIYQEGDDYCGEIITQPNVTIIYIKNRTAGFDSKIQTILSTLVDSDASQVWSNYLSAASDRTLTAAGRRVRIVVGINGGHSQIVIYN